MSTRRSAASPALRPAEREFAADVEYYLTLQPRQLPSRYLYDALGSALFDAICELPWYRVTRAELSLLALHGAAAFTDALPISRIVELGPGNGAKLLTLLEAGRPTARHIDIHLIDVSEKALARAVHALDGLENVDVITHVDDYEDGLAAVGADRHAAGRTLALFLGSNIGNFDAPGAAALLRQIGGALQGGDLLLLGADLVKPERELLLAYDDPLGVTAAFNRNLLVRINRELGGTFDVERFAHRATWNDNDSRVEMHLVSLAPQHVRVGAAGLELDFHRGETIWTESSYKYEPGGIAAMLHQAGLEPVGQWVDRGAQFALTLAQVG